MASLASVLAFAGSILAGAVSHSPRPRRYRLDGLLEPERTRWRPQAATYPEPAAVSVVGRKFVHGDDHEQLFLSGGDAAAGAGRGSEWAITQVTRVSSGTAVPPGEWRPYRTVAQVFDEIESGLANGARRVEVTYDDRY